MLNARVVPGKHRTPAISFYSVSRLINDSAVRKIILIIQQPFLCASPQVKLGEIQIYTALAPALLPDLDEAPHL